MTRETTMRFDAVADDGHTTHFTTPAVKGDRRLVVAGALVAAEYDRLAP